MPETEETDDERALRFGRWFLGNEKEEALFRADGSGYRGTDAELSRVLLQTVVPMVGATTGNICADFVREAARRLSPA